MRSERRSVVLSVAVLVAMFALALAQSWARWLEPIIDTGRDLYIPEQLAYGAKLYRDIRYQYPPLAPYLLAAITSAIGHSLASYIAIGIAQSLCAAALIWSIARRSAGTAAAFAACAMFVALNVAGATTWGANWIFPYSYAATIGMVALLGLIAAIRAERVGFAVLAALVASWCKVEYAIAVILIVVAAALLHRIRLRWFIVAALTSAAIAALIFRDTAWLSDNIFNKSLTEGASAKHFYAHVSGAAGWPHNLGLALIGTLGLIAVAWLLRTPRLWPLIVVIALLFSGDLFLRAFGVIQWAALAWAIAKDRRSPLALFAIASIASTLRIALNVSHAWYGAFLSPPVYLLIAYLLFEYLPERGAYTRRAALLWLVPIAFICGRELFMQHEAYAEKRYAVVTKRGTFYDHNPDRARALNEFTPAGGTLVVIPEGVTLNYLAGLPTPLTFHTFTPVETANPDAEQKIIAELTAHPPTRIAIVTRDVREFGYQGFGVDYDRHLAALIAQRYRVERRWRGPRFELLLLKSTSGSDPEVDFSSRRRR